MVDSTALQNVIYYHDGTKHHFNRFARSVGYLDWASQPRPFRSFDGAPAFPLYPTPEAVSPSPALPAVGYQQLFGRPGVAPAPITAATLGYFLRHSLGLSAWKVFRESRWPLRVNPSSGNLHPTEAYIATGPLAAAGASPGGTVGMFGEAAAVWHYAADRHVLERRCAFDPEAWHRTGIGAGSEAFIVALTSIHWRESWKYGERAFRYCQHDLGHAIAALGLSAALCGWRMIMLSGWPQRAIATLTGIDRDEDYFEAEREEPACALLVTRPEKGSGVFLAPASQKDSRPLFGEAVRTGRWSGRASQLSEDHVQWTFIDEVARATEDSGHTIPVEIAERADQKPPWAISVSSAVDVSRAVVDLDARTLILQRRSALAFDGVSSLDRAMFLRMLARVMPAPGAPWDAVWWPPHIHLALFVHRVGDVAAGLYVLARASSVVPRLRLAFSRDFAWTPAAADLPLWLLREGDYRSRAQRVSCDQDIAADGCFSLGMIADFEAGLEAYGAAFYRHLFWESGVVGQALYLEAEAAGARATGIGCFYDDAVHELLGLDNGSHAFQSLYHFTVGMPVEDTRLTTEPGYRWDSGLRTPGSGLQAPGLGA